ncbi:MAG: bifunctional hydroxymethylpyrimidine kinase/phosphomethylpyrimidine kinase [Acidimicrobiales bacterium]
MPCTSATPPVALTIAGTDSGGGAGIAADLRTFAAHRVFGTLAVTAVTAQNTCGVQAVRVMDVDLVAAQIDAVMSDLAPRAAKTGMLAHASIVSMITSKARAGELPLLVVDPVLVASSGGPLFEGSGTAEAYGELVSVAAVVTPNLPEASLLVGEEISDIEQMEQAARRLHALGGAVVVVKGGHHPGTDAVDVMFDGRTISHLAAPWVTTRNVHGTGCSYSAAITANLALGCDPLTAAIRAKQYVHRAITLSSHWELGEGHGPIDHLGAAAGQSPPGD